MVDLVRLPKLGANIQEGAVGAWRTEEGESVRAGQALAEIITSKATFEIECPCDGVLRRIIAPEKSNIPTGYILAIVADADADIPDVSTENERIMAAFRAQALAGEAKAPAGAVAGAAKVRATPGARRLAAEFGVDLAGINLPPGRNVIGEDDVRAAKAEGARREEG